MRITAFFFPPKQFIFILKHVFDVSSLAKLGEVLGLDLADVGTQLLLGLSELFDFVGQLIELFLLLFVLLVESLRIL